MTPPELHRALEKMHPRSAQILGHWILDARTREECAALYGLKPEQWDVLFHRAVNEFERALGREPSTGTPPAELQDLATHRDEVKRLIEKSNADYEASPRFTVEIWARRIAIAAIVALTLYFYLK